MPLPPADTIQVATKATQHYLDRLAASRAGGPLVDFTQGIVILGDGNGTIPPIDDLVVAENVTHEVARGSWVQGVNVAETDAAQTDVLVVVPTTEGGVEIGPFWVTEYAITDENGDVCLVGTTAIPKLVTANGGLTEVAFIAAEKESNGVVVLTPPSAAFATLYDILIAINANHVDVTAPLTRTDTILPTGYKRVVIGLPGASPPAEADPTVDAANIGYGRPATQLEFDAGASLGGFAHPWPRLQQVRAEFDKQLWRLIADSGDLPADIANFDVTIPDDNAFALRVMVYSMGSAGTQGGVGARVSMDGVTFIGANYFWLASSNLGASYAANGQLMPVGHYIDERANNRSVAQTFLDVGAANVQPSVFMLAAGFQAGPATPTTICVASGTAYAPTIGRAKKLRFLTSGWSATSTGQPLRAGSRITVEAMR